MMYLQRNLLLLFCVFSTFVVRAQDWNNYQTTKSGGTIPQEFLTTSTEKYEKQRLSVANDDKRTRKKEEKFFLESNFKIDELLLSGKVIFNEPISDYVNAVADKILENDPSLRKKLQFYVVKSPVPNAFATERGIVLVNIGLLSRLESEAQLAYILCHEITHYTNEHVMKSYLHKKDLQDKKSDVYKEYKKSSYFDKLLVQSNYSKANEMEADKVGFERFAKTGYAPTELTQVFDILEGADRPYAEFDFDVNKLLKPNFIDNVAEFLKVKEVKKKDVEEEKDDVRFTLKTGIKYYDDDDDEVKNDDDGEEEVEEDDSEEKKIFDDIKQKLSTHPSPIERQEIIDELLGKITSSSKQSYLVSQARFDQVKKMAQFELCQLFLEKRAYFDAYYQALLLKSTYDESRYINTCLAKALYGITKYRNAKEKFPKYLSYKEVKLLKDEKFLNVQELNKLKLNTLALAYSFDQYKADTTDAHIAAICDDLIFELLYKHKVEKSKRVGEQVKNTLDSLKTDRQFAARYEATKKEYKDYVKREAYYKTDKGRQELYRWQKSINRKGFSLGLKKVVVFSPLYYGLDIRKRKMKRNKSAIKYVDSEQKQIEMNEQILLAGRELGLKVELLDAKAITKASDVAKFNDMAAANSWYTETLNHDEVDRFVPMTYTEILTLSKKYGTNHFANLGMLAMTSRKRNVGLIAAAGLLWPVTLPVTITIAALPRRRCYTYSVVYNVKENRPVMAGSDEQKRKVKTGLLHHSVKNQLYQMKKKR